MMFTRVNKQLSVCICKVTGADSLCAFAKPICPYCQKHLIRCSIFTPFYSESNVFYRRTNWFESALTNVFADVQLYFTDTPEM